MAYDGVDDIKPKFSWQIAKDFLNNTSRIIKIVWSDKKWSFLAYTLLVFFASGLPFLGSAFRGFLIDELIIGVGQKDISTTLIIYLGILIAINWLQPFVYYIQNYIYKIFSFFLSEKFELLVAKKRGEIDIAVHEDPKMNDLFLKTDNIWRIQNFFSRNFDILESVLGAIISLIVVAAFNWWVLILIVIASLPEFIISASYGYGTWDIYGGKAEVKRRFFDLKKHFDKVPSLVELKIFKNINYFISSIRSLFLEFQNEEKKNAKNNLKKNLIFSIFSQLALGFAIAWFTIQTVRGNVGIGSFTFILASIVAMRSALSSLFVKLGQQYEDSLFMTDIFKFLDIEPMIKKPEKGIVLKKNKTPQIVFENVSFAYPGIDKLVLKDFSLTIKSGEKVALVGINGAGKTTFVKLLCRFYDPTEGRILIDGRDLKEIDLDGWWDIIGALFQDYSNYHFQIKEAIAIGRMGNKSDMEKVKDAAKAAEADIFIEEWEKKYDQMLGKQFHEGVEPSIGQWQKLALARTFYRDPRLLILDEPTSSIDAEAEAKIFERLEALPKDRSVVLISHRFSTVRQASKIAVIKDGMIDELGTHTKLLKDNKDYARLFKLQAKGYK